MSHKCFHHGHDEERYFNSVVIRDIDEFKKKSDLIIANRMHTDLYDVKNKTYTRALMKVEKYLYEL